jgi:hypothetical protein
MCGSLRSLVGGGKPGLRAGGRARVELEDLVNCHRNRVTVIDLYVSGFYYPSENKITHAEPRGKRELAEKFV